MIYACKADIEITDVPVNQLMAEFTTAGQALVKKLIQGRLKRKFINELMNTAFLKIQEEIENGGK